MSGDVGMEAVFQELADLRRRVQHMMISGPVKEVKGDKLRVVIGKDLNGQDVLSPWMDTTNHRGGATERRFFKEGQNVTLLNPSGDLSMGMVVPYAPNNNMKAPDHANESGQDEEPYQLGDLRVNKTTNGYDVWLGNKEGAQSTHKVRINKDGGITVRMKDGDKKLRVMVHKLGTKLKSEQGETKQYFVVLPDRIITSSPAVIDEDPIPDDNE